MSQAYTQNLRKRVIKNYEISIFNRKHYRDCITENTNSISKKNLVTMSY